jgi:8-oxo-dGTP pyrophosphatase MutT (NUDIX family)
MWVRDFSYGIVPVRQEGGRWQVLLIKHRAGHWSFPKGHAEGKELPKEAAVRELREETGLEVVRFFPLYPFRDQYEFFAQRKKVCKTVLYYLAQVQGEIKLQEEEVSDSLWIDLEKAALRLSFAGSIEICTKSLQFLNSQVTKVGNFR